MALADQRCHAVHDISQEVLEALVEDLELGAAPLTGFWGSFKGNDWVAVKELNLSYHYMDI